jgi:hypothetical protein
MGFFHRKQASMHWSNFIAIFFGGAFFSNTIPHLVNGVSGSPFQSPFAKPPGKGLSSSTVNVLWGFFNLLLTWLLLFRVASFDLRNSCQFLAAAAGALVMSLISARGFGRFHGGNTPTGKSE